MATEGQAVLPVEGEILHTHQGLTAVLQEECRKGLRYGGVLIQGELTVLNVSFSFYEECVYSLLNVTQIVQFVSLILLPLLCVILLDYWSHPSRVCFILPLVHIFCSSILCTCV